MSYQYFSLFLAQPSAPSSDVNNLVNNLLKSGLMQDLEKVAAGVGAGAAAGAAGDGGSRGRRSPQRPASPPEPIIPCGIGFGEGAPERASKPPTHLKDFSMRHFRV